MNIFSKRLSYNTSNKTNIIDITEDVNKVVGKSMINNGIINISVIGSTASISTIEYESGLIEDMNTFLEQAAPSDGNYMHNERWHDGNGYSHIRSSFMKTSQTFQVENGKVLLGIWQQIILLDFDNKPRERNISVKVMGK